MARGGSFKGGFRAGKLNIDAAYRVADTPPMVEPPPKEEPPVPPPAPPPPVVQPIKPPVKPPVRKSVAKKRTSLPKPPVKSSGRIAGKLVS